MVGRDVLLRVDKQPAQPGEALLAVEGLSAFDDRGIEKVREVSFDVKAGEIVGIAGIDGNGQTELIDTLCGLRAAAGGTVLLDGVDVTNLSALAHYHAGLGHIPEDRQRRGLVLEFSDRREHRAARLPELPVFQAWLVVPAAESSSWAPG